MLAPWAGVQGGHPRDVGLGEGTDGFPDLVRKPTQHTGLPAPPSPNPPASQRMFTDSLLCGGGGAGAPFQPHGGGERMLTGEAAWGGSPGAMSPLRVFP